MTSAISGSTPPRDHDRRPRPARPRRRSPAPAGVLTQSISGLASGPRRPTRSSARSSPRNAAPRKTRSTRRSPPPTRKLLSYAQIDADTTTLQSAAQALSSPTAWQALTATSSNPNAVTVSAGTGIVDRQPHLHRRRARHRRAASAPRTSSRAPRTGDRRTPRSCSRPAARRSASRPSRPTRRSRSAATRSRSRRPRPARSKVGGTALGASTTIDGTNDTLQLSIDGNPFTLTLAHGTYTPAQLAAAVQAAATTAGAPLTASVDPNTGALQPHDHRRRQRGDAAGHRRQRARPRCSLSTDGAALTGTDGKVQVDGGAVQTVTDVIAGPDASR